MPVFAGEALKNYHVGFDLLVALIHKITLIPVLTLYFQVIPPILAFLIGFLTYKFVFLWQKNKTKALWSTFFVYFGGSFGWIVSLLKEGRLNGESMFWSQQAISTLINPPFALSLVFLLLGLIGLLNYQKNGSKKHLLLTIILFGILIQIKVYAGLLVLASLFVVSAKNFIKNKDLKIFKVFLGTLVFSSLIFLLFNKNAGSMIVFKPFWFLETMMGLTDRLGWTKFYSAMTNYRLAGQWIKAVAAYIVAFVIFYYGNLGTRIILELGAAKWGLQKKLDNFKVFFISIILIGTAIPMFFLQKGTPWNTIQFFYYSLFAASILAGIVAGEFLVNKKAIAVGLILFTIPTTIGTLKNHYLPKRSPSMVSSEELEALKFLSKEPGGIVLTYPFDEDKAKEAESNPPRPLYLYAPTAYVSAFSKKDVYLEDEINLDITGFNWQERRIKVERFLNTLNQEEARSFLKQNNISYIYWVKDQRAKLGEKQLGIEKIFENEQVDIFKKI